MEWIITAVCVASLAAILYQLAARRARHRLFADDVESDDGVVDADQRTEGVRRWLELAGLGGSRARSTFYGLTSGGFVVGATAAWLVNASAVGNELASGLEQIPGGVGDLFLPVVQIGPWFIWLALSIGPTLYVRRCRRLRVEQIEQDLPIVLDLLATLAESGVAFDAAIARLYGTRLGRRPLGLELRRLQADLLAGRGRVAALRRLGDRTDVLSVQVWISALVQAEQLGMALSPVLRRQADELRDRRRERANALAAALPVKMMFPLIACFLPGIFLWTLGPIFRQFFQLADAIIRSRGLR